MRESLVDGRIRRYLESNGWFVVKIHGGPYQMRGLPDRIAVRDGRHLWIETKRLKGGVVSPIQKHIHEKLREHGAEVIVARSLEECVSSLKPSPETASANIPTSDFSSSPSATGSSPSTTLHLSPKLLRQRRRF